MPMTRAFVKAQSIQPVLPGQIFCISFRLCRLSQEVEGHADIQLGWDMRASQSWTQCSTVLVR